MNKIIARKKAGERLTTEEIEQVVKGATTGEIPDYQISALLMAICFQGMDIKERSALTRAMAASGRNFNFAGVPGTKVDKHSTGGVGDKTSLILAPWLAAAGAKVPMISGRGLGFTGGTLDKLAAIPGYRFEYSEAELSELLKKVGCFIIGQTADIAPADKKIYALRDVTSTVDEISLITASILSKKFAEGLDRLVMDVKCGSGAFMQNIKEARALAKSIRDTATAAGVETTCLLTAMDFPLGRYTGNTIETFEAYEFCQPQGIYFRTAEKLYSTKARLTAEEAIVSALVEITVELAAAMLGRERKKNIATLLMLWKNGSLKNSFENWVSAQGGNLTLFTTKAQKITAAFARKNDKDIFTATAPRSGFWHSANGRALGNLMVELGAGRKKTDDAIEDAVSLELLVAPASAVKAGQPILRIYKPNLNAKTKELIQQVLKEAVHIKKDKPKKLKNILI